MIFWHVCSYQRSSGVSVQSWQKFWLTRSFFTPRTDFQLSRGFFWLQRLIFSPWKCLWPLRHWETPQGSLDSYIQLNLLLNLKFSFYFFEKSIYKCLYLIYTAVRLWAHARFFLFCKYFLSKYKSIIYSSIIFALNHFFFHTNKNL